jgi:hypothetical protein
MRNVKVSYPMLCMEGVCADSVQNTYLITINVTNKQKERYYHEYVPELLDVSYNSLCVALLGLTYASAVVATSPLRK